MQIRQPDKHYDLVVVGGGLVGASFCCALEAAIEEAWPENPLSILVVEAIAVDANTAEQSSFDARSTALSFGSRQFFENIGLWQELGDAASAIHEIQVSDRGRLGSVEISREEQNVEALGYVVENKRLGQVLNARLDVSQKISLLCPALVSAVKATEKGMQLVLAHDGTETIVDTPLVVLAEGGKSPICKQLGIAQSIERYDQHALITNIAFEKPHQNIAFERFTDTGPLAVLPLQAIDGKNRGSLVWTLSVEQAEQYKEMGAEELLSLLQERFGYKLGKILEIGETLVYPLSLSIAKEQVRPGIVLLGNVAHTLHPVAGLGLNLALRDVQALVDALITARQRGLALGEMSMLLEYVAQQEADQAMTTKFTHNVTKLFSSNNEAKIWLRKFGLVAIELLPTLRRSMGEQLMGLGKSR